METTWALLLPFSPLLFLPLFFFLISHTKNINPLRFPPTPSIITLVDLLLCLSKPRSSFGHVLRRLSSKYGPIVTLKLGFFSTTIVFDRHLAHEALVQKGTTFSDRELINPGGARAIISARGHSAVVGNGAIWRVLRRNLVSEILHPTRLRLFSTARRRVLNQLHDDIREQALSKDSVILPSTLFRRAVFQLLAFMCFGDDLDVVVAREIERVQCELMSMGWRLYIFDFIPFLTKIIFRKKWKRFLDIRKTQERIMLPLIMNRKVDKDHPRACYVDSLVNLEIPVEGGDLRRLRDDEIVSLCSEFFDAGTDSTVAAFEWIFANVIKNQHVQQRLLEEIDVIIPSGVDIEEEDLKRMLYLRAVVLEGLRRHPPAPLVFPHVVLEDTMLGGYNIPKGSSVNFAVAEMGWDENVWEEPLEFRPERFLDRDVDLSGSKEIKMMPFGVGRRMCPGYGLALLHVEYFLASLVRGFEWKVVNGEEIDLSEKIEFTMVMKNPLRCRAYFREAARVA